MAVIPGYQREFKKYNLQMLAGRQEEGEGEARPPPVKVADLIKMRKLGALAESGNAALTSVAVQGDVPEAEREEDDNVDVYYKPKNDILEQMEAEKAIQEGVQVVQEDSSDDEGPRLI